MEKETLSSFAAAVNSLKAFPSVSSATVGGPWPRSPAPGLWSTLLLFQRQQAQRWSSLQSFCSSLGECVYQRLEYSTCVKRYIKRMCYYYYWSQRLITALLHDVANWPITINSFLARVLSGCLRNRLVVLTHPSCSPSTSLPKLPSLRRRPDHLGWSYQESCCHPRLPFSCLHRPEESLRHCLPQAHPGGSPKKGAGWKGQAVD